MTHAVTFELSQAVQAFLFAEAELLDSWNIHEWLGLLDPQIRYRVPLRETRMKEDCDGFSEIMALQDDDLAALETRARRLDSKASWSENPPTRIRHHISNIRINAPVERDGQTTMAVKSNILVVRTRGQDIGHDVISGERHDVLVGGPGNFKLLERVVYLDHTTIDTHNLAFFL